MITGDNRSKAVNDIKISNTLLKKLVYIILFSFKRYFQKDCKNTGFHNTWDTGKPLFYVTKK